MKELRINTVIFDLDGTLVNSIEGIAFSMNHVLKRHDFPTHSVETYKTFVGNGVKELVRCAVPADLNIEEIILQVLDEMREEYLQHWDYQISVYEGIYDLLGYLHNRGLSLAIDTNKDENATKCIVDRFFSDYHFSYILGSNSSQPKKPDPTKARWIADKLGVLPGNCIYFGDSEIDIQTARDAGMKSVSAAWGFRKKEDLISAHAGVIINKPMDLINLL